MGLLSSSFQGVSVRQGSQLYLEEHHCPWWWHRALQLKAEYRNRTGSRARPHSLKDWSLRENLCQLGPASCKLHNLLSVTTCDQVLKSISLWGTVQWGNIKNAVKSWISPDTESFCLWSSFVYKWNTRGRRWLSELGLLLLQWNTRPKQQAGEERAYLPYTSIISVHHRRESG